MRPGSLRRGDREEPTRPEAESPDLQTFLDQADPDGFYGEADLLDLCATAFPAPGGARADRRLARIKRLRKRQAAVLAWLEARSARRPSRATHAIPGSSRRSGSGSAPPDW